MKKTPSASPTKAEDVRDLEIHHYKNEVWGNICTEDLIGDIETDGDNFLDIDWEEKLDTQSMKS